MIPHKDNLVLWQKLNGAKDASGNTLDFSGNGNSGVINGDENYEDDSRGKKAQVFDGTYNYVRVGDNDSQDTGGQITLSLWFKTSTNSGAEYSLVHDESEYKYLIANEIDGTRPGFYIRTSSGVSYARAITNTNDGKWHHLVGVYNKSKPSNRIELYIDNQIVAKGNGYNEDILAGDEGINIGTLSPTTGNFNGSIRDVAIWNVALSPTEVKQVYNETQVPARESPKMIQALDLDGDGNYVSIEDNENLRIGTSDFTISVWFKSISDTPVNPTIVSKGTTGPGEWMLRLVNDVDFYADGGNSRLEGVTEVRGTNKWHHTIITRDGNITTLYLDGENLASAIVTDIDLNTTLDLQIGGAQEVSTRYFNGSIDEVRIYNRALSTDEISALYNRKHIANGLVAWYPMNGNADDYSGNDNNGTLNGNAKFKYEELELDDSSLVFKTIDGVKDLSGKNTITNNGAVVGNGMEFDGASSLQFPKIDKTNGVMTICLDIEFNSVSGNQVIINEDPGVADERNYSLYLLAGTKLRFFIFQTDPTGKILDYDFTPVVGTKYNFCGVADGSYIRMYLNGEEVGTPVAYDGTIKDGGAYAHIGKKGDNSNYFNGKIHSVKIYNEAKSPQFIKQDYLKAIRYW